MRISVDTLLLPGRRRLKALGGAYLGVFVGLLLTLSLWEWSERVYQRNAQAYFDFRVGQLLANVTKRFETYQQILYGTRGLFEASVKVERREFYNYVKSLHLDQRYPGIQGVGLSLVVPREELEQHQQFIRAQGFPDYRVYPAGERDVYTSIVYLEPFAWRNQRAFGYDMFSEPVRRQAMIYARDRDTISLSGKVILVQETETDVQAGFLMYLPLYKNAQPYGDEVQRRANIIGWVYSPFRIKDFIQGIDEKWGTDLHLSVYDGSQIADQALMYSDQATVFASSALKAQKVLQIGGHAWTLAVHSDPEANNWLMHTQSLTVLISGACLSFLLGLLIREFIARGEALDEAAMANHELVESESRFRLMADSAPVLIWMANAEQEAVWLNRRWLDFTGKSLVEEMGGGWLESVHPAHLELVKKLLDWHYRVRSPFSVEYQLKRYDGTYRWVVNSGVPRIDENGQFIGFIGSCIDITNHKEMEEELWELATVDGLTGFLNRRHFMVRLQEEFNRLQRNENMNSSVLMLDLDYFKRVNDQHGHACGDAVLKHFADIVRSEQRKVDVVGRLGGEEFAVILPYTGLTDAQVFAERLRKAVARAVLQHYEAKISITVSIGIALMNGDSANPDNVLRDADRALYMAKEAGRNRVVLWQETK